MPIPINERLRLLHAHYTSQINAAVAADRMDLVRDLANDCENEALALMLAAEGDLSSQANQQRSRSWSLTAGRAGQASTDRADGGHGSSDAAAIEGPDPCDQ